LLQEEHLKQQEKANGSGTAGLGDDKLERFAGQDLGAGLPK